MPQPAYITIERLSRKLAQIRSSFSVTAAEQFVERYKLQKIKCPPEMHVHTSYAHVVSLDSFKEHLADLGWTNKQIEDFIDG